MELKLTKTYLSKRPSKNDFLIALIALSSLMLFFGIDSKHLVASGQMVFENHEYWRAFTTTLLHADLNHLAHNAFYFTGLAMLLYHYFGFWIFPIFSLLIGGPINLVVLHFYPPEVTLVGVSGVVYFMAAFWLSLYILIERRQGLLTRFMHAIGVSLIFLFPEVYAPQTSYLAHGIGFLFGIMMGPLYYLLNRKKIRSKEEWVEIKRDENEMENTILLDENSYHQMKSEDPGP